MTEFETQMLQKAKEQTQQAKEQTLLLINISRHAFNIFVVVCIILVVVLIN